MNPYPLALAVGLVGLVVTAVGVLLLSVPVGLVVIGVELVTLACLVSESPGVALRMQQKGRR